MANQNSQQEQQNQRKQQDQQNRQRATPGAESDASRSEALLPADTEDEAADGRYEVAEEVSLDQQSDAARRVGQAPEDLPLKP